MAPAIVLCGGQGIRLRPLTVDTPKPLIPVAGRPIVDHIIDFLQSHQITDIRLAGGYLVEELQNHFKHTHLKVHDTGDADIISRIRQLIQPLDEQILVLYGDTLSDVNIQDLLNFSYLQKDKIVVTAWPLRSNFGLFQIDETEHVSQYLEKPSLDFWVNIGYFVIPSSCFELLDEFSTFEALLLHATSRKLLVAYRHRGTHITINTRAELEDAEQQLNQLTQKTANFS